MKNSLKICRVFIGQSSITAQVLITDCFKVRDLGHSVGTLCNAPLLIIETNICASCYPSDFVLSDYLDHLSQSDDYTTPKNHKKLVHNAIQYLLIILFKCPRIAGIANGIAMIQNSSTLESS